MNASASGLLTARIAALSHSIALPALSARLPTSSDSVSREA
jgi:hypothetical protein